MRIFLTVWAVLCLYSANLNAQAHTDTLVKIPVSYVSSVTKQAAKVDSKISKENKKAQLKWARQEKKLLRLIMNTDSTVGAQLQNELDRRNQQLTQAISNPSSAASSYIPSLDTLKSSLNFLNKNGLLENNIPGGRVLNITAIDKVTKSLNQSALIHQVMLEKQAILREKLTSLGLVSKLKSLNKIGYYYKAQIDEYKLLLKDHKKLVRRGLAALQKSKQFQEFMQRNSQLASMFRLPGNQNDPSQNANLSGLQTRAQVNSLIQQQVGAAGVPQIRGNIAQAQIELNSLKDKVLQLGGGGSDIAMPDGFKPNPYKTKSLLKRIELGANIQSQRARGWLPARSDIGISIGYKFQPNLIVGLGGSYRIGWGRDIRHMKISHQGISLRSFVDVKIKGSFWLTGGYELNQVTAANDDGSLASGWEWQQSGLIGTSKVLSMNNKILKKTKLQIFWQFISSGHSAVPFPIIFRVGYNF